MHLLMEYHWQQQNCRITQELSALRGQTNHSSDYQEAVQHGHMLGDRSNAAPSRNADKAGANCFAVKSNHATDAVDKARYTRTDGLPRYSDCEDVVEALLRRVEVKAHSIQVGTAIWIDVHRVLSSAAEASITAEQWLQAKQHVNPGLRYEFTGNWETRHGTSYCEFRQREKKPTIKYEVRVYCMHQYRCVTSS